ncbi:MAG: hypothetical protein FWC64_01545 [Treponema sp.]|nr:hypothetical protein [Treponema sp.]
MKRITVIMPLFFAVLLGSCFGLNADISLNPDGSGTIALEYRVSRSLDALGRLDGNERWNTIPVGRADFERTLDRLPQMRLVSFSSTEDERDIIVSARLEFLSVYGLLEFLDASGRRASFAGNAGSGSMVLTLSEGAALDSPELSALLAAISEGYSVGISMSFPGTGSLAVLDSQGQPLAPIPSSEIHPSGRRVSGSFPLYEVLTSAGGISLQFSW